ncbi:MAG: hypothetical protein JSV91_05095 [Phycisphaerales bacterium]|nr:MAG: hypothetical protein JSV91_05095 [Phycisphaerales bacterium]
MANISRYLCLAIGAMLIAAGLLIINSDRVQEQAVSDAGRLVASRMIGGSSFADLPAGDATGLSAAPSGRGEEAWSFLGPQVGGWMRSLVAFTTAYLAGILIMVFGAAVLGLAVPSGAFGAGELPEKSSVKWACLLMLAQASFFLGCGFAAYIVTDFRGGHLFLGTRSSALLVTCAAMTSFSHRSRAISLFGYYCGLLLTPVLGLNFLRLALKQPVTADALGIDTVLKVLMAISSFVAIVLLWRAVPGGLSRARASLQLRRLAAGAGAAVLLAGFCITKASMLPQQALAEGRAAKLIDDPQVQNALAKMGVPEELIEAGRQKLADPATDLSDMESLKTAAVEVITEWQETHAPKVPDRTGTDWFASATPGRSSSPFFWEAETRLDFQDLTRSINELSPEEVHQLLRRANIDVDVSDPCTLQRLKQEAYAVDLNDPRVRRAIRELDLDRQTWFDQTPTRPRIDHRITSQPAQTTTTADVGMTKSSASEHHPEDVERQVSSSTTVRPLITRPLPSPVNNRVPDPRIAGSRVQSGQGPTQRTRQRLSRPPVGPPPPEEVPDDEPTDDHPSPPIEVPLLGALDPEIVAEALPEATPEPLPPVEVTTEPIEIIIPDPGEPVETEIAVVEETPEITGEEPEPEAQSSMTAPPPPPPPPAPLSRFAAMDQTIQKITNRARGYGILFMLVGSITFLAAVLLRRTGWSQGTAKEST